MNSIAMISGNRTLRFPAVYRHFKGRFYIAYGIAQHTETNEKMVVYQALYGDKEIYVRPFNMFASKTDRKKYPDAVQEYRMEQQEWLEFPGTRSFESEVIKNA